MSICLISLISLFPRGFAHADEVTPQASGSAYVKVTGDDAEDERSRWDSLFNTSNYVFGTEPISFLKENVHLLPVGKALDMPMSEGRNSVFLAKKGFQVTGIDYSDAAIRKARRLAHDNRVTIRTVNADLTTYQIPAESYDVILDIDFLQRSLITQIKRGLKHGGVVLMILETEDQYKNETGKTVNRREPLLRKGELQEIFKDYKILVYKETNDGKEAYANLIAKKP